MNKELQDKFTRYKQKPSLDFASELLSEVEVWINAVEFSASESEMDKIAAEFSNYDKDQLIDMLIKMLVISGNGDKLALMQILNRDKLKKTVDFLYNQKDRVNHLNIYTISTLLEIADHDGWKVNNLADLVRYARGL